MINKIDIENLRKYLDPINGCTEIAETLNQVIEKINKLETFTGDNLKEDYDPTMEDGVCECGGETIVKHYKTL